MSVSMWNIVTEPDVHILDDFVCMCFQVYGKYKIVPNFLRLKSLQESHGAPLSCYVDMDRLVSERYHACFTIVTSCVNLFILECFKH